MHLYEITFHKINKVLFNTMPTLIKIQHRITRQSIYNYIYNILFLLCVSYKFIKDVVISFSHLYLSSKFLFQLGNPYDNTNIGTSNWPLGLLCSKLLQVSSPNV